MKSGEEAVSTLKKIANDASNILDEKPPRKEVRDAVTNMELSTMPKSQRGFQPPQPVGELKQPVGELKQPVGTKPEGPGDTLVAVEEEEEEVTVEEEIENIKNSNEINFTGTLDAWKGKPGYELIKAAVDKKLSTIKEQTGFSPPSSLSTGGQNSALFDQEASQAVRGASQTVRGGRKTLKKRKKKKRKSRKKSKRKSRKGRKSRKSRKK